MKITVVSVSKDSKRGTGSCPWLVDFPPEPTKGGAGRPVDEDEHSRCANAQAVRGAS